MGCFSTKATSGIIGAGTQTQQENGIPDNAKIFFDDTKKSVRYPVVAAQLVLLTSDNRPVNLRGTI